LIFCRLKSSSKGEVRPCGRGRSGPAFIRSDVAEQNLFSEPVDGLIAGGDDELAIARPVQDSGPAALGTPLWQVPVGEGRRALLRSTAGRVANRFNEAFLLLSIGGGKFRCRNLRSQNGMTKGRHLLSPVALGMNFVPERSAWVVRG